MKALKNKQWPMQLRVCSALLLFLVSCAVTRPRLDEQVAHSRRLTNLRRAAALPWNDEGRCVVQEASQPWPIVVDRCFHALDTRRIRFRDIERRCPVALVDGDSVKTLVGICLLTQPELVVGAVVIIGIVVVAVAIHEELEAAEQGPEPEVAPSGGNGDPPRPSVASGPWEDRPECTPVRVTPRGGHPLHNQCADNVPFNDSRGYNVVVNGKAYDALQPFTRTLWEVKTNAIETYNPFVRQTELKKQVEEGRRERDLAAACGYQFVIGVRTQEHKTMLDKWAPDLVVVLMPWC